MNKIEHKRKLLLIISIVLTSLFVIGTVAYIFIISSQKNKFILGTVPTEIIETYDEDNNIRENVSIKNVGNTPIYIRVANTYYFVNDDEQIIKDIPEKDVDYLINFSSSNNWILSSDGYYYYKLKINPGDKTDVLIENCSEINKKDNKTFMMDLTVQSIQAIPSRAVKEAWGISVEDNKLIIE